jgi:hypothetical protein
VKKEEPKREGLLEPFKAMFQGLEKIVPTKTKKKGDLTGLQKEDEKAAAKKDLVGKMWTTYKNYKKAHKMIAW